MTMVWVFVLDKEKVGARVYREESFRNGLNLRVKATLSEDRQKENSRGIPTLLLAFMTVRNEFVGKTYFDHPKVHKA